MAREKKLQVRVLPIEENLVTQLASHYGIGQSGVVRMLIYNECRKVGILPKERGRIKNAEKSRGKEVVMLEETIDPPIRSQAA